nr:MAG TPA: hypothetical protein [Caudoviricetes sp.]
MCGKAAQRPQFYFSKKIFASYRSQTLLFYIFII